MGEAGFAILTKIFSYYALLKSTKANLRVSKLKQCTDLYVPFGKGKKILSIKHTLN
jgi:hypothetical protein